MRLKTLGVLITLLVAIFVVVYWVTDDARRAAIAAEQEEELLEFGELVFSVNPSELAAAGCARCHGDEGQGGPVPNDPNNRQAPSLRSPSLAAKIETYRINTGGSYVELVVRNGGVAVSGDVNSPLPAWGQTLNDQQIEAVVTLVESWAAEAAEAPPTEVENTVEAGAQVYTAPGTGAPCSGCHGADLAGVPGTYPDIRGIGSALVTDLPTPPSGLDQMQADYDADPRQFLEKWIRDSSANYNGGQPTGMPAYPEDALSDSLLQALITFLLEGDHGG